MTGALSVEVRRRLPATCERAFDAFLDPARAGRFMFATPGGEMVRVDIDARVGGHYMFTERRAGEDVEHRGEYLEIERPRRLAFTFLVPKYSPVPARVVVEFEPTDDGCEVVLTQEMAPELADDADRSREGWGRILEGLTRTL